MDPVRQVSIEDYSSHRSPIVLAKVRLSDVQPVLVFIIKLVELGGEDFVIGDEQLL